MQTLKLETFKNIQTGNTAEMLTNDDVRCLYYKEICALGVAEGGRDNEGTYWATWTPKGTTYPVYQSIDNPCLDEALRNLEYEIEDVPRPWYSGTTGL
jgi:hypothetical protein